MITYKTLYFGFVILIMSACQSRYHIDGHVSGMENQYIMLFKFKGDTIFSVDTSIIKNSKFVFEGPEFLDDISILSAGNYPDIVKSAEVVLDRGKITVNLDNVPIVNGTSMNNIYNSFKEKSQDFTKIRDSLIKEGEDPAVYVNGSKIYLLYRNKIKYKRSFLINNIKNPVGLRVFKTEIKSNSFIGDSIFQEILPLIPKKYQSDPEITKVIESRKIEKEKNENRLKLVGKKYIDFELLTPDGRSVKLSDYMGKSKFTIIEFWASWCGPCIEAMPRLKRLYSNYNNKGLQIISISLDDNMSNWQRILKKIDVPWIHLSDLKGKPSALTEAYYIEGIPRSLLIDKEGTIIEVNISPQILEVLLQRTSL